MTDRDKGAETPEPEEPFNLQDPQDRALWQRYATARRADANPAQTDIEGDTNAIAAYLEGGVDEWDRAAFERRLVDEPALLDAVVAARAAYGAPMADIVVPQAVRAYALNLVPAPSRAAAPPPRSRLAWFTGAPVWAWSLAVVALAGVVAVGTYLAVKDPDAGTMAGVKPGEKDPIAEELDRRSNSIFTDPAKTYFDGTDVE